MSRTNKDKARIKRFRKGSRVLELAAIFHGGSGAHKNRKDKRLSNTKNDWRSEW